MRETSNHPSLLSYLLPKRGAFCLRLQPTDLQQLPGTSSSSPFVLLNDGDPLAHTFCGAFVTDSGSVIKDINLLIQRDTPVWPADSQTTLTNTMVDKFWQQAMNTRCTRTPEHSMALAAQIGEQQQLLAFASLFYCKKKQIYFEIPCLKCGQTLQLCKDELLLADSSLAPYSTSLHRYLFCPTCSKNDTPVFYTLEKNETDPPTVRDCRQLILEFGSLTPATEQSNKLPCLNCSQHSVCYGDQQAIHETLFPLSFYPFYMLITECDSLEGFHLLALLHENKSTTPVVEPSEQSISSSSNDKAIHTIIQDIADNWQQKANREMEDITLTGEIPSEPPDISAATAFSTTLPTGYDDLTDDLSQETIIIKSPVAPLPETSDTLHTDTVLLSPDAAIKQQLKTIQSPGNTPLPENNTTNDDIDLAETLILRPGEKL